MTKKTVPIEGEIVTAGIDVSASNEMVPALPKKRGRKPKALKLAEKQAEEESALALADPNMSIIAGVTTQQLKIALNTQTEQRQIIADFIKHHLKKDVDFGRIHVVRNCADEERRRGSCTKDFHFSKSILYKPGQEKIFSLFGLTSDLVKDEETMLMLEGTKGLVAYKCIVMRGDTKVAEGRGAATVGDNRRDVNATIKIAEKRARMDACLALGFSEYFAQDLDDPDYQSQRQMANEQAAARAEAVEPTIDDLGLPIRPKTAPIDDAERVMLARYFRKMGIVSGPEQISSLAANGIENPAKMTSAQAREMIRAMKDNAFVNPKAEEPVIDDIADDVDIYAALTTATANIQQPAIPPEPELVIDDDLKNETMNRFRDIGLNKNGHMWFMKMVCGRPFAKPEQFSDNDWRRCYDIITGILEGAIEVDDRHLSGVIVEEPAESETTASEGDNADQ